MLLNVVQHHAYIQFCNKILAWGNFCAILHYLGTFGYPLEGRGGVESSPLDFFPPGALSSSFLFVPLPRPPPSFKSDILYSGMNADLIGESLYHRLAE